MTTPRELFIQVIEYVEHWDIDLSKMDFCEFEDFYCYGDDNPPFYTFCGATKGVFCPQDKNADFVLKFTFTNCENDYCRLESDYYKEAVKEGLADAFAATTYFDTYNDIDFYIQKKVSARWQKDYIMNAHIPAKAKEVIDVLMEASNNCTDKMPSRWVYYYYKTYGEDALFDLFNFIDVHGINDLHGSNLGVYHNKPIIFDYSGYWEESL